MKDFYEVAVSLLPSKAGAGLSKLMLRPFESKDMPAKPRATHMVLIATAAAQRASQDPVTTLRSDMSTVAWTL